MTTGKLLIAFKFEGETQRQTIEVDLAPDEISMPLDELFERVIKPAVYTVMAEALPK